MVFNSTTYQHVYTKKEIKKQQNLNNKNNL